MLEWGWRKRGEVGRCYLTWVALHLATTCQSVVAWCPSMCLHGPHGLHGLVWSTNTWIVFESRFNLHASCLQEEEVEEFRVSSVFCCCGWQPRVKVHLVPTATLSSAWPPHTLPFSFVWLQHSFIYLPACACVPSMLHRRQLSNQPNWHLPLNH